MVIIGRTFTKTAMDLILGLGTIHIHLKGILYLKRLSDGSKEVEINGNVGIGTTSPGGKLDVVASTEGGYIARFKNSSVASDEDARIVIEASDAGGESQILLQTTNESTQHKWNIVAGSGITPSLGFQYDSDFKVELGR